MVYWLVVCASLAAAAPGGVRRPLLGWAAVGCFALLVLLKFPPKRTFSATFEDAAVRPVTAEQIGNFLNERLLPGDRVQPMDWTKGAVVHGLLLAEAEVATSSIYDFHFYHHVSSDYIRALRLRFLRELDASNARFVVRGKMGPRPSGVDTSRRWPGLEQLLAEKYRKVINTRVFAILERRDDANVARDSE